MKPATPPSAPPSRRVFIVLFVLLMALLAAQGKIAVLLVPLLGTKSILAVYVMVPVFVVFTIVMYMRYRRYARWYNGEVCRRCNYPLQGLAAPGVCPECGSRYNADRDRAAWRMYL